MRHELGHVQKGVVAVVLVVESVLYSVPTRPTTKRMVLAVSVREAEFLGLLVETKTTHFAKGRMSVANPRFN